MTTLIGIMAMGAALLALTVLAYGKGRKRSMDLGTVSLTWIATQRRVAGE